jgi:hypothetical protein
MADKAKPEGNRKRSIDLPMREMGSQEVSKPSSSPGTIQAVVRVVEEFHFAHFYLACGHLITVNKHELRDKHPQQMECPACAKG